MSPPPTFYRSLSETAYMLCDRSQTLGNSWVQKLETKDQAVYAKKLQDGQDTVQAMLMMMQQFQSLQKTVEASTKRMSAVADLEQQGQQLTN